MKRTTAKMIHILFPDARFSGAADIEQSVLAPTDRIELHVYHEREDGPGIVPRKLLQECDAMIVYHKIHINEALLDAAPQCRMIVRAGVGFNNIDLAACGARGIPVCNVPDYGITEIADHAIALLLTLVRGIASYNERLLSNPVKGWSYEGVASVRRIRDSTIGIVGFGRIGSAVAQRAAAFDMKVVYYDPFLVSGQSSGQSNGTNSDAKNGVRGDSSQPRFEQVSTLEELLARSDVVSLHLPLTDDTRNLIDANAISMMKPGAILINTARGPMVNTTALYDGLRSGQIGAAGLDVLPTEPPNIADPLVAAWQAKQDWIRDRLLLSPHAAFYSAEGYVDLRRKSIETALAFLCHGELRNCVNATHLDRTRIRK